VQPYIQKSCSVCTDFSAELADISVGGLGLNGWSLVIIRSETGEKFFKDTVKAKRLELKSIRKRNRSIDLLVNLSQKQRMNATF